MEMISISKLRRHEDMLSKSRDYFVRVESLLQDVVSGPRLITHPFFIASGDDTGKTALFLVTSDTGLCSVYNHGIINAAEDFLNRRGMDNVMLIVLGKKGFSYFKRKGYSIPRSYIGLNGRYSDKISEEVLSYLTMIFLSGQVRQVYAAYMQVRTASRSKAVVEKLLNIERVQAKGNDYIMEPGLEGILAELIPVYLSSKMKTILLNAFTAEHQARAIAMGEATQNATELLEALVLLRNKVRQANITREILEIISTAEALKG
jgi:F-type H+-transporting ATPase subunit gamma